MSHPALPTSYAGVTFRSRLEARWAIVFDRLGIRWEYEHEGFEGAYGECYLPDFWLPDTEPPVRSPRWPEDATHGEGIYAEVKGSAAQLARDRYKIECAIDYVSTPVAAGLLILGCIPPPDRPALHSLAHWHKGVVVHTVELVGGRVRLAGAAWSHVGLMDDPADWLLEPCPPPGYRTKLGAFEVRDAYNAARTERFGT